MPPLSALQQLPRPRASCLWHPSVWARAKPMPGFCRGDRAVGTIGCWVLRWGTDTTARTLLEYRGAARDSGHAPFVYWGLSKVQRSGWTGFGAL
jgi:hypothetical protein